MGLFFRFIASSLPFMMLLIGASGLAEQWRPVRGGILYGISGMALVSEQSNSMNFLVVHDNKGKDEGRLAIVTVKERSQPEYQAIDWPNNTALPADLEAITSVPSQANSFMTVTSSGTIYHIQLEPNSKSISVLKVFNLPDIPPGSNFEGFAVQEIDGNLVAVWAHRGQGNDPAKLYWGTLDLASYNITLLGSIALKVPFPNGSDTRHVSDLKIDKGGVVFISSASDPGNDGPFDSAVYVVGFLAMKQDELTLRLTPALVPIYRHNYHKIEAIELVPGAAGGVIVGTDDENMGSSII
jgi:hypothetical protein